MSMWTLIIMLLANGSGNSAITHMGGFSSRDNCLAQAVQIQQVQVAARRIQTMCVEVK